MFKEKKKGTYITIRFCAEANKTLGVNKQDTEQVRTFGEQTNDWTRGVNKGKLYYKLKPNYLTLGMTAMMSPCS